MELPIKGLKTLHSPVYEKAYYFTEDMKKQNVIIEKSFLYNDEETYESISCRFATNEDSGMFTLIETDYIESIQLYRIIKDVVELYEKHSLKEFLEIMYHLSGSSVSSASQKTENHRQEIRDWILESFEEIEDIKKSS